MSTPISPSLVVVSCAHLAPKNKTEHSFSISLGFPGPTRAYKCLWDVLDSWAIWHWGGGTGSPRRKLIQLRGRQGVSHSILVGFLLEPTAFPSQSWAWLSGLAWPLVQFSSVTQLHLTLWDSTDAAHQASLSITNSQSLLKLLSMCQGCHPTISSSVVPFSSSLQSFPAKESFLMSHFFVSGGNSIDWIFSFSITPSNEYSGLISFRMATRTCLRHLTSCCSLSPGTAFRTSRILNYLWSPKPGDWLPSLHPSSLLFPCLPQQKHVVWCPLSTKVAPTPWAYKSLFIFLEDAKALVHSKVREGETVFILSKCLPVSKERQKSFGLRACICHTDLAWFLWDSAEIIYVKMPLKHTQKMTQIWVAVISSVQRCLKVA